MAEFEKAGAAIAPIYDIRRTLDDPQYQALNTFLRVEDADLGTTLIRRCSCFGCRRHRVQSIRRQAAR